jgi:hypothetical protein
VKECAETGWSGSLGVQARRSLTTKLVMLPYAFLVLNDQRRYLCKSEGRRFSCSSSLFALMIFSVDVNLSDTPGTHTNDQLQVFPRNAVVVFIPGSQDLTVDGGQRKRRIVQIKLICHVAHSGNSARACMADWECFV